jgi:hypothetical protein
VSDGNGESSGSWEERDRCLPEWTWCARRESEDEEIITLSSDALAALIAEKAADLKRHADRECKIRLTRFVPRVPG